MSNQTQKTSDIAHLDALSKKPTTPLDIEHHNHNHDCEQNIQADYSALNAHGEVSNQSETAQRIRVPLEMSAVRLDKALVNLFSDFTRAKLQQWLAAGRILIDGQSSLKASYKLKGGEFLEVFPEPPTHMLAATPEPINFPVLHQDKNCLVIDKPAGLVVHPAMGHWHGTLMNGLLYHFPELIEIPRAGIVHRLDKDTSGLMMVARTQSAQLSLIKELSARRVRRIYLALVWGRMTQSRTVQASIARDPRNRLKMAVQNHGKAAVTHFYPLAVGRLAGLPVSLLACKLETGRTHQIRAHAQYAGFGLVGDPVYTQRGVREVVFNRQALHACHLQFFVEGKQANEVCCVANLPNDMLDLLDRAEIARLQDSQIYELAQLWPLDNQSNQALATINDLEDEEDDFDEEQYNVEINYVRND